MIYESTGEVRGAKKGEYFLSPYAGIDAHTIGYLAPIDIKMPVIIMRPVEEPRAVTKYWAVIVPFGSAKESTNRCLYEIDELGWTAEVRELTYE